MNKTRLLLVCLFFAGVAAAGVMGARLYVREQPANISFLVDHKPHTPVNLTIQQVGTMGPGKGHIHSHWVSYLVKAPNGVWVHTTQWLLPAHTRINVADYEYDTGSPLRNEVWGLVQGVIHGSYQLYPNGKGPAHRVSVVDTYAGNGAAHTFTVPELGINVPLYGVAGDAPNQCAVAPCTPRFAHNLIKFSFVTPGPGVYRWQCFVPCGSGFLDGNGGPMDTLGYMAGYLKVQAQ